MSRSNSAVDLNSVLSLSLNNETPSGFFAVLVRSAMSPARTSVLPMYSSVSSSYDSVTFPKPKKGTDHQRWRLVISG